jgi:hypothetical protein
VFCNPTSTASQKRIGLSNNSAGILLPCVGS